MSNPSSDAPEFSRPVAADTISSNPQHREIVAEAAEREALGRRFGLLSLAKLTAVLDLQRQAGEVIHVCGHLSADAVQRCVVSLVPVPAHIETDFEVSYGGAAAQGDEGDIDPVGIDAPEPLVEGRIDLGEAVAQQLAIALDPYPRAPGASLDPDGFSVGPNDGTGAGGGKQPFAALAALKKRQ
jgi:uncharacterized metal-binding protein YceD (DUF177 family)